MHRDRRLDTMTSCWEGFLFYSILFFSSLLFFSNTFKKSSH
jgi:hypothetical protein